MCATHQLGNSNACSTHLQGDSILFCDTGHDTMADKVGVLKGAVQRGGDAMARVLGSVLPDPHCMDCRRWSALIRLAIARHGLPLLHACCVHILCSLHNEYLSPTLLCCRMFGRSPQQGGLVWRSQGLLCPFICMFSCAACVRHGQCQCIPPLVVALARCLALSFFFQQFRTHFDHALITHAHRLTPAKRRVGRTAVITVPF